MGRTKKKRHRKRRRNYNVSINRPAPAAQSDGKTFLIVVEGQETERRYLMGLRGRLELKTADVVVEHAGVTDPMNMVSAAVELRERRREAARTSVYLTPYDEVWVVVDREAPHHVRREQLPPAKARALAEKVDLVVSDPCFEFWLLLHYVFTTKPFSKPEAVISTLRKHDPAFAKNDLPLDELFLLVRTAVKNADACLKHHASCGGDGNPSTHVHYLVRSLDGSAAPVFRLLQ